MEKPEVVKPADKPKTNGNGSMYASYAKDIFCAIIGDRCNVDDQTTFEFTKKYMDRAIELV